MRHDQIVAFPAQYHVCRSDACSHDNLVQRACRATALDDRIQAATRTENIGIRALTALQNIVACATLQNIVTGTGIQGIGSRIPCDAIGGGVPRSVDRRVACKGQVFDVCITGNGVRRRRDHGIHPRTRCLGHNIRSTVDVIGVVPCTTNQGIVARTAIQNIVPGITGQGVVGGITGQAVVACIAGTIDSCRAGQRQMLQIRRKRIGNRGIDRIHAFPGILDDGVRGIIDVIRIIPRTTDHAVGPGTAIDDIIACATGQGIDGRITRQAVVARIAGTVNSQPAEQFQILDILAQRICNGTPDGIVTFSRRFGDHIADSFDVVHIVPGTARHGVITQTAFKDIVTTGPIQDIGTVATYEAIIAVCAVQHI